MENKKMFRDIEQAKIDLTLAIKKAMIEYIRNTGNLPRFKVNVLIKKIGGLPHFISMVKYRKDKIWSKNIINAFKSRLSNNELNNVCYDILNQKNREYEFINATSVNWNLERELMKQNTGEN
jgi:hypothetical protein